MTLYIRREASKVLFVFLIYVFCDLILGNLADFGHLLNVGSYGRGFVRS